VERRLGNNSALMRWGRRMIKPRIRIATATVFLACLTMAPVFAQDYGRPVLRYGDTSGWYYDGRDDNRDFPTNGLFPGNFATNPANAWIGAAGIFGSTPWRSATAYPSQVVIRSARDEAAYCANRHRSDDRAFARFPGKGGARHRC
jgi:hypothetical protein